MYGAQIGFKIFLNITPTIVNWTSDSKQFSLLFDENPLADFVELPDDGRAQDELWFSNILCGILRGALEMVRQTNLSQPSASDCQRSNVIYLFAEIKADLPQVQMQIEAHFVSDVLKGNDTTEMRVTLLRYIEDEMPPDDE
jgi:trafficking protein particle complex subunit 3